MQFLNTKIRSSFFDDSSENYRLWKKGPMHKKPSEVRIMEGLLFKRSSGTNFWKSRYYVLFEDRLAYYKNNRETKEKAYCLLQNIRVERISNENEKDERDGLRLMHNMQSCDLFARNKDQYERWMSALASYCVLTDYASNFINMKVIGKGSFAKVYLVKKKNHSTDLAVKTFDKHLLLKQEKARASLINEINVMRILTHDNIIKLFEVYESDNHVYLVLELLNGGELFDRIIKKGQYSERDACILMKKLLNALSYMHSKGIMHRDIKPENLILKDTENDWNVMIADFGLATEVNPNNEYLFRRCGTPGYVAPEVLADAKYDQKVDVFSAGVILFILLTGGSPFYGKSYNEILWKNKNCDVKFDFADKGLKISEKAIDLLKKMLVKDPVQRISAEQALQHEWVLSGGISPTSPVSMTCYYLSSAQDNMKRFQEENRFNVKSIKPKDLDRPDLEKCGHAPSPLINGKMTTIADSRNLSYLNSPDWKWGSMNSNKSRLTDSMSPKFMMSLSAVDKSIIGVSPASTFDESDDLDAVSDEQSAILDHIEKYRNGFNLISQVKDGLSSSTSSSRSTPLCSLRTQPNEETTRKAMNVQGQLLGYITGRQTTGVTAGSNTEQQKKTNSVKNYLKNL